MRRSKLYEGMWVGDLADLVQPLVSIDEYASKIDKDAIAIGFYVHDKDAAEDLNRFVQKSPVSIIDSDVSPAPDQRGFYIVFVELTFNDRLVSNITSLLDEISPLVSVEEWQMKVRNIEGLVKYDGEKLVTILKANRISDQINALKRQITSLKTKGHPRKK
jgi:23S rRNA U2552 (ribose-2'-O)-methylase RlmE/FtsJ